MNSIPELLNDFSKKYTDRRLQVWDVSVQSSGETVVLQGKVLEKSQLDELRLELSRSFPQQVVDDSQVKVLRQPENRRVSVAVNLTDLHAEPSWLSELLSQVKFGYVLEVLEERDRWAFVRQEDGYLGWAYLPYTTGQAVPMPTHLVSAPLSLLRSAPGETSGLVSRVLGGVGVQVVAVEQDWAEVNAHLHGWLPLADLRSLKDLPATVEEKRNTMMADAAQMLGVPYLWGGGSANGIDCSGLAQLLHRWVGITIPRDADMQCRAGRPVKPPFRPGDLIFFGESGENTSVTHVGISTGGWNIVHSSRSRNGVYYDDVQAVEHLRDFVVGSCSFLD